MLLRGKPLSFLSDSAVKLKQVKNEVIIEKKYMAAAHKEADVIMFKQALQSVLSGGKSVCLISGNTDIFILLIHFIDKLKLNSTVYM